MTQNNGLIELRNQLLKKIDHVVIYKIIQKNIMDHYNNNNHHHNLL